MPLFIFLGLKINRTLLLLTKIGESEGAAGHRAVVHSSDLKLPDFTLMEQDGIRTLRMDEDT